MIQTIENETLIQKCISKSWTLEEFLSEASQIDTISEQVHDMKAIPWRNEIAKVAARRRYMKSRNSDIGKRDQVTEPCSYCGLSGAHLRGRNCPAYGVQCEICRIFDHFSSVCRANMSQKGANLSQSRMNMRHPQKKIKRTEESYFSDESSDDGFIAQSVGHLRINAVRTSNNLKIQANENSIIEERLSQLENELKAAKLLIEDLVDQQQRYQYFSLMQNDCKVPPCTNQTGLQCQLDANEKKELKSDPAMVEERKSVTAQPFVFLEQKILETENQSQNQKLRIQDDNQIIGNKVWRKNRRKKKH